MQEKKIHLNVPDEKILRFFFCLCAKKKAYRRQRQMGLAVCDLFWICLQFFFIIETTRKIYKHCLRYYYYYEYMQKNNYLHCGNEICHWNAVIQKQYALRRIGIQLKSTEEKLFRVIQCSKWNFFLTTEKSSWKWCVYCFFVCVSFMNRIVWMVFPCCRCYSSHMFTMVWCKWLQKLQKIMWKYSHHQNSISVTVIYCYTSSS